MTTPDITTRPKRYDRAIISKAAASVAKQCVEWAGEGDPEDWIENLVDGSHHWGDGYDLAKYLDDQCFVMGVNAELVEILDNAGLDLSEAHREAVKAWVASIGFTPFFSVGDFVTCRHGTGPVREIFHETAEYVVSTTNRDWGNGGGYVIAAEDVSTPSQIEEGKDNG